jgi:hypothetical protein
VKDTEKIIKMLRSHRMGCFGCGYEHNCRDNGCHLMQMAANELDKLTHRTEPENKPLTMEELRRMDGEPVFAIPLDKNADWIEHWEILRKDIVTANSISTKGRMYFLYLKDYGKTWLAYAHKPERSE